MSACVCERLLMNVCCSVPMHIAQGALAVPVAMPPVSVFADAPPTAEVLACRAQGIPFGRCGAMPSPPLPPVTMALQTSGGQCPECSQHHTASDIVTGLVMRTTAGKHDYTSTCQRCGWRFVARFSVVVPTGRAAAVCCEFLPPATLAKVRSASSRRSHGWVVSPRFPAACHKCVVSPWADAAPPNHRPPPCSPPLVPTPFAGADHSAAA